jgi:hypothetical protein
MIELGLFVVLLNTSVNKNQPLRTSACKIILVFNMTDLKNIVIDMKFVYFLVVEISLSALQKSKNVQRHKSQT